MRSVYCAVRTEYLNVIWVNLSLQMFNTIFGSSVARSEMTGVAAMVMKVGQRPRTGDWLQSLLRGKCESSSV